MVSMESLPWWLDICAFLGFAVVLFAIGCTIKGLYEYVEYQINRTKYKHKMTHRFDKPPLAKCYCRDCEYWYKRYDASKSGKCDGFAARHTADDFFCKYAKPCKTDPDIEGSQ